MTWRVGTKVPINVYDGDRPVCQCHTNADAKRIVDALNGAELRSDLEFAVDLLHESVIDHPVTLHAFGPGNVPPWITYGISLMGKTLRDRILSFAQSGIERRREGDKVVRCIEK